MKDIDKKIEEAEKAALQISNLSNKKRERTLVKIASTIRDKKTKIINANKKDVKKAEELLRKGEYSQSFVDRLKLSEEKIESISSMVESVASQEDPLGKTLSARKLDDSLNLYKVTVPIGVIGSVFESRPDALVQIASLCLKSGNSTILKGGSEAKYSNRILFECIAEASSDIVDGWVQLIEAREDVEKLLEMDDSIDLLMPRGSSDFVEYIQNNTRIPVLGHTEGICHVYIDSEADLKKAEDISYDAKVQYPAVCNAVEALLIHEEIIEDFLPSIVDRYKNAGVKIKSDEKALNFIRADKATEKDWTTEYNDLIISIKTVSSLKESIDHINKYGSKHTDSIVTENKNKAKRFMKRVDSASVFHNTSTRFSDGYRYGLGAEVGISTGKTHARGPVGLEGLTTYKYYLEGNGHIVSEYVGENAKEFKHETIDEDWK